MKILFILVVFMIPALAEDWKTADGKIYQGVKVVKVEPDAVTILDNDGGALIPLANLPADIQKRFNYDPAKAKAAADARAESDQESAAAMRLEREQAERIKRSQDIFYAEQHAEAEKDLAALQGNYSSSFGSSSARNGTVPVAAPRPAYAVAQDEREQKEWSDAQAVKKQDEAKGCAHSSARIIQVLPDGILVSGLMSRWGIYNTAFIKTDSTNMIDDQAWSGVIVPQRPYHYTTALGASATVPGFTTDLKETASEAPVSNYVAPQRPVSSMTSVGGGA